MPARSKAASGGRAPSPTARVGKAGETAATAADEAAAEAAYERAMASAQGARDHAASLITSAEAIEAQAERDRADALARLTPRE